jgi:hypothetical protein
MPNAVKYNVSAETLALKKGNFWIGTGDVGKGPTSSTGFYNGLTPPTGGFTIYLNKASGGPSIYTVSNEAQLTALTNSISVSTNLIKNNNGGNFADGTIAPFNGSYGTMPTVVDITNDKPYNGSTSTKAAKFLADGGMLIYTDPSPFNMTVGVTYTLSFWYRQTSSKQFYIAFNNQGGSGDMNGNLQAYSAYGMFPNPTQTWQRCSWTFTNVVNKPYFFIYRTSAEVGAECLMTEFTLTEGSMPSGPGLTTSGNCLNWFSTQTDKMIFNRDYESIVTNGLMLNFDAGFSPSFATIPPNANTTTVTPLYDLSSVGNNGTLANGPSYTSANGGGIVLDGTDDTYSITGISLSTSALTIDCWFKYQANNLYLPSICAAGDMWSGDGQTGWGFGQRSDGVNRYYFFGMMELGYRYAVDLRTMVDGTIYNFVGTRTISGTQQILKGYVNGQLIGSVTNNTIFNLSTSTYFPGYNPTILKPQQYYAGGANPPPATLYNIKVYNRDLSVTEIIKNYQSMLPRFVGENIVTDGLILYLDAGYKSSYSGSGTTWYDVSGYGNHGTLTNGPTFNSSNGGSIIFDGADDYANLPNGLLSGTGDFTIIQWVQCDGPGIGTTFGNYGAGTLQFGWSSSYVFLWLDNGSAYASTSNFTTAITMIAGRRIGTTTNYLKNGTVIGTGASNASIGNSNTNFRIGTNTSTTEQYKGKIYTTMVYNRGLSNAEILQNYNTQKGRFGL